MLPQFECFLRVSVSRYTQGHSLERELLKLHNGLRTVLTCSVLSVSAFFAIRNSVRTTDATHAFVASIYYKISVLQN